MGMLMTREEIIEIQRKLAVFDFGRLQELLTLFDVLEREGLELEDVKDFIASSIAAQVAFQERLEKVGKKRTEMWNKNTRKCPTCDAPLVARSITTKKGKQNVKGYTCHWFCQEENCNFEEYTYEDFKEIYQEIMQGGR